MADRSETDAIEWEAAQWVARRMSDEPFDEAGFNAWLAGAPRRRALFETMWQRFNGAGLDEALEGYARRRQGRRAALAGVGAAVLMLAGGYAAWPSAELLIARPAHFAVAPGMLREIALDDGTRLTLAGGAELRVRYTRHDRVVELSGGTVFADVAHDARRPFRIEAGGARITDLGTRFEVATKPGAIRVTVEAGAVRFAARGWERARLDLAADQAATLDDRGFGPIRPVQAGDIARWRHEWAEYRDAPLSRVIDDLESASPLPIRIEDAALGRLRVSGRIRLTDPARQLDNLAVIHAFHVTRVAGAIILSGTPPRL